MTWDYIEFPYGSFTTKKVVDQNPASIGVSYSAPLRINKTSARRGKTHPQDVPNETHYMLERTFPDEVDEEEVGGFHGCDTTFE